MAFLRNLLDSLATNRHNAYWQRTTMMTHSSRSHTTASFWHSLVSVSPIAAQSTYSSHVYLCICCIILFNMYIHKYIYLCILDSKVKSVVFLLELCFSTLYFRTFRYKNSTSNLK